MLEGGCGWIQLRLKDFDDEDIERVIAAAKPLCRHHVATLIIDDRVDMAKKHSLDGVHLGIDDMSIDEARSILGNDAIIGATANTVEEIVELSQHPMSYFGVGPMRYTDTKKNLRRLIGLEGYNDIVAGMRATGVDKPAVAIGGIELSDVNNLLATGLWGVAVSGAIIKSGDMKKATADFMKIINEFNTGDNE